MSPKNRSSASLADFWRKNVEFKNLSPSITPSMMSSCDVDVWKTSSLNYRRQKTEERRKKKEERRKKKEERRKKKKEERRKKKKEERRERKKKEEKRRKKNFSISMRSPNPRPPIPLPLCNFSMTFCFS